MEVYVVMEYVDQNEYTEPQYYESAAPAAEIKGIYTNCLRAYEAKERMEQINGGLEKTIRYEVEAYDVEEDG